MTRDKQWQQFENFVAEEFKEIAPFATHTKGSRYGDIKNIPGLHVECKSYSKKNVYQEDWMKKCMEEIPFHSGKIPVLVTKNKENDIRVHLTFHDFLELYIDWYKMKFEGGNNG